MNAKFAAKALKVDIPTQRQRSIQLGCCAGIHAFGNGGGGGVPDSNANDGGESHKTTQNNHIRQDDFPPRDTSRYCRQDAIRRSFSRGTITIVLLGGHDMIRDNVVVVALLLFRREVTRFFSQMRCIHDGACLSSIWLSLEALKRNNAVCTGSWKLEAGSSSRIVRTSSFISIHENPHLFENPVQDNFPNVSTLVSALSSF
jgi:hypothetical protein